VLKVVLVAFLAFILTSLGFTPILGIVAAIFVGIKLNTARGDGYEAVRAKWWVDNFFVTGFCCALIWVVGLVITAGAVAMAGPAGGIVFLIAVGAVVYTGMTTWRESPPPAEPDIAMPGPAL